MSWPHPASLGWTRTPTTIQVLSPNISGGSLICERVRDDARWWVALGRHRWGSGRGLTKFLALDAAAGVKSQCLLGGWAGLPQGLQAIYRHTAPFIWGRQHGGNFFFHNAIIKPWTTSLSSAPPTLPTPTVGQHGASMSKPIRPLLTGFSTSASSWTRNWTLIITDIHDHSVKLLL